MFVRLSSLSSRYAGFSSRRPHLAAAITASSILSSADLTCQLLFHPPGQGQDLDWRRTLSLAVFGFFYYGGPCKWLYLRYDVWMPGKPIATALFDACIHTPFLLVPCFYAMTGAAKGQTPNQITQQLQEEWMEASFGSILFWVPICIFNFRYVPQHSRILVVGIFSFLHKTWLSAISNRQRYSSRLDHLLFPEPSPSPLLVDTLKVASAPSLVVNESLLEQTMIVDQTQVAVAGLPCTPDCGEFRTNQPLTTQPAV
eukprot:gb/GEZN01013666.1/.p1 GENE.gb/GEZN01013666.1/~~gb/GEZN01013666.1/.p1  ORF type:complete len:256 (+),score=23.89 gb/GEZN01013666.1/:31-798(+)